MATIRSIGVILLAAVLGGCGGGKQQIAADGPNGVLRPASAELEGAKANPSSATAEKRFVIAAGKDVGKTVVVLDRVDGGSIVQTWTIEGEKRPRFERHLIRDDDGALAMREQRSFDRAVVSVFDPPLMVFPAKLAPGESFTMSSKMVVHPIDKPKSIKERGTAKVVITLRGLQSPGRGKEPADVVRTVFTADLQSADVTRTTDRWVAPGFGLVVEQYEESVKVFGVVVEKTAETFILSE